MARISGKELIDRVLEQAREVSTQENHWSNWRDADGFVDWSKLIEDTYAGANPLLYLLRNACAANLLPHFMKGSGRITDEQFIEAVGEMLFKYDVDNKIDVARYAYVCIHTAHNVTK